MGNFFTAENIGTPFMMFGWAHLGALAVILFLNLGLHRLRGLSE